MKLLCPITKLVWKASSSLPVTAQLLHPIFSLDFRQLREMVDTRWSTYSPTDKHLLWAALLAKSPLITLRGPLTPSPTLIEATIHQVASLLTWVATQRLPQERFPSFIPDNPSCENLPAYLKLLAKSKADFIAEKDNWNKQLTEQEETARMDKLLARYLSRLGADSECLPDSLATWVLTASGTPLPIAPFWRLLLTKPAEKLLAHPDFRNADLEELIEHLEDWQHPTLLRFHALRALRQKLAYTKVAAIGLDNGLDWLLTPDSPAQEKIASHGTFTIEQTGTTLTQPASTPLSPEQEAEKLAAIKAKQAEMAEKAKLKLAAIRAGQNLGVTGK